MRLWWGAASALRYLRSRHAGCACARPLKLIVRRLSQDRRFGLSIGSLTIGVLFGVVFKLLMKAVVMPLVGADPVNQAYHFLVGNLPAIPGILYAVIVGAGFGEETLFRGYMFERLGKLFSAGASSRNNRWSGP